MQYRHIDDPRFLKAMAALGEAVSQDLSDAKLNIYASALQDIPIADIERACWQIIRFRTTASFPKVGEIIEAIMGKVDDVVQIAMAKIEKACRFISSSDSIAFDDPVIHAVIHANGGWEYVKEVFFTAEWPHFRRKLEQLYAAYTRTGLGGCTVPLRLAGFHERNNLQRNALTKPDGQPWRPPTKYIGDIEQIKLWRQERKALAAPEEKLLKEITG